MSNVMNKTKSYFLEEKLIMVAFILSMLVCFPTLYFFMNQMVVFVGTTIILATVFFYYLAKCNSKVPFRIMIFLICYLMIICPYWMLNSFSNLNCPFYLIYSFCILMVFNYYLLTQNKQIYLFSLLVKIITTLAVISLFFWIFGSCLGWIKNTGASYIEWGGYRSIASFYNIYFEPQNYNVSYFGIRLYKRNCAIFVEAPLASFIFSLALLFNINYAKVKPFVVNTILIVSILSTLSTIGIIVLLLCILQKVMEIESKSRLGKILKFLFFLIGYGIVIGLGYQVLTQKLGSASGMIRSNRMLEEIEAFMKSPLWGHGMGKYTNGSSNSFCALLADGGLILWGIYYIPMILNVTTALLKRKKIDWFTLNYTGMFLITVVQYNLITIFMLTFFWNQLLVEDVKKDVLL